MLEGCFCPAICLYAKLLRETLTRNSSISILYHFTFPMLERPTSALATDTASIALYYYKNDTSQVQIIRVVPENPQRFEKVVFPGEQFLFYATPDSKLNIYTSATAGLAIINQIPCAELPILEERF